MNNFTAPRILRLSRKVKRRSALKYPKLIDIKLIVINHLQDIIQSTNIKAKPLYKKVHLKRYFNMHYIKKKKTLFFQNNIFVWTLLSKIHTKNEIKVLKIWTRVTPISRVYHTLILKCYKFFFYISIGQM